MCACHLPEITAVFFDHFNQASHFQMPHKGDGFDSCQNSYFMYYIKVISHILRSPW